MRSFESYPIAPTGINWTKIPEFSKKPLEIKGGSGFPLIIYFTPLDERPTIEFLKVVDPNSDGAFFLEAQVIKSKENHQVASFGVYSLSSNGTQEYLLPEADRRKLQYPDLNYAQPDFFSKQFILCFLKRCSQQGTRIDYIQDWYNRGHSIIYDQFMAQFDYYNYLSLSLEAREQLKIQLTQNTWSASVYAEAGFTTIKNVHVDTQYNLMAAAQFWP